MQFGHDYDHLRSNSLATGNDAGWRVRVWFHTFKQLPTACDCNGKITILAECADGREVCENADRDQPHDLACPPKPCRLDFNTPSGCGSSVHTIQIPSCKSDEQPKGKPTIVRLGDIPVTIPPGDIR